MTLQILIHNFCDYLAIQKQRSTHTISNYKRDINQFFSIIQRDSPMHINDSIIHLFLTELNRKEMAQSSIHRKISALDQFWRYLIDHDYIAPANPWAIIRRPKINHKIPAALEANAMLELLNGYPKETLIDRRNIAILELLFSSGIRVAELIQIKLADIHLKDQEFRVIGKGTKERLVLFGTRAQQAIQFYLDHVRPLWEKPFSTALFISNQGQSITTRTVQRLVKHANQYHSSTLTITPHGCRHTCASLLLSNGAGIRDIQELLGHSSISTTQRYASIPTKKLTQRFLDAMNE